MELETLYSSEKNLVLFVKRVEMPSSGLAVTDITVPMLWRQDIPQTLYKHGITYPPRARMSSNETPATHTPPKNHTGYFLTLREPFYPATFTQGYWESQHKEFVRIPDIWGFPPTVFHR